MTTRKDKKKILQIILIIIAIILLIFAGVFAWGYNKLKKTLNKIPKDSSRDQEIITNEDTVAIDGYKSFVIFGVDTRDNSLKRGNTDTIIVVNINDKTKDVKMASIYRDTYAYIPDIGYDKINSAYAREGYPLALSTINLNYDLDIKKYLTVNFKVLVEVIDFLDGITLDIKENELKHLNGYINELNKINKTNVSPLKSAGKQNVNGTQATAYARIRYTSGGDFKRTERQRIVIEKIFQKTKKLSFKKLNTMVDTFLPMVYTNFGNTDIMNLLKSFFSYKIADETGFPFEKDTNNYNKESYVYPIDLQENVKKLHLFLYNEENYIPSKNVKEYSAYIEDTRKKIKK